MKLYPVGLLALALLLVSGCWADAVFPCETDANCPTGMVCDEGLTHRTTGLYVCMVAADDDTTLADDDDTTPVDDDDTTAVDDDDASPVDDDDTTAVDDDDTATPCDHAVVTAEGVDLVSVCAGTFDMGCTAAQQATGNCSTNESPVHTVTLTRGFQLGTTEVTQSQWQALMGNNPSYFSSCGTDCPVEMVNWWDALSFANAMSSAEGLAECYTLSGCSGTAGVNLNCTGVTITAPAGNIYDCDGYRLPTEAEWEYAARGGTDLLHSGSDVVDDVAWYGGNGGNSGNTPHPVATKEANGWGLYDLSGNVWEWTQDWYSGYSSDPEVDPPGPSTGSYRGLRGGSWDNSANNSRAAYRYFNTPGDRYNNIGFRVSRSIP